MTDEEIISAAEATGLKLFGLGMNKDKFEFCILAFAKFVGKIERFKEREACVKIADEVINSERDRTEEADHNNNESYEGYDDGWFDACNTIKFFVKKQGEA